MASNGNCQPLSEVRAVFLNVIQGKKFKENGKEVGEPRYDGTFVLTKEQLRPIIDAAIQVAKERFPKADLKELKFPWMSAEKAIDDAGRRAAKAGKDVEAAKAKYAKLFPAGTYVLKASSKLEPVLAYSQAGKVIEVAGGQRAAVANKFYAGGFYVPQLKIVAYEAKKLDDPNGVNAYLNAIFFHHDGEKIGGVNTAEAFSAYAGKVSNENPIDDDIPF